MSALAAQLGIGRSTLYRLVGNRDDLLGVVLAEATERTFRRAAAGATAEGGVDLVLEVINRFMHAVIDAEPLQALCKREPLVFIRLALLPGAVEQIAAKLIAEMLQTEATAAARSIATRHHTQPSHRPNVRRPPLRPPARWDRARDRHRPRPRCRASQSPQQAARARLRPDPLPPPQRRHQPAPVGVPIGPAPVSPDQHHRGRSGQPENDPLRTAGLAPKPPRGGGPCAALRFYRPVSDPVCDQVRSTTRRAPCRLANTTTFPRSLLLPNQARCGSG